MFKLFSTSHIKAAKEVFPEKVGNKEWHLSQWSLDEIMKVKVVENSPDRASYKDDLTPYQDSVFSTLDKTLKGNCASLGCGCSNIEYQLATKPDNKVESMDCYDYENFMEDFSKETRDIPNIHFYKKNVLEIDESKKYDNIILNQLLYALNDKSLNNLLQKCSSILRDNGNIFIFCTSKSSPRSIFNSARKILLISFKIGNYKEFKPIGYMRSKKELERTFKENNFKFEKQESNLPISYKLFR